MKKTKIQWHPGFVSAMGLELRRSKNDLLFEKEYNLNTKPLEIDLLIIRKNGDVLIDNEIGKIFRGHNILEYKSPEDHLNIDVLYKVEAYAALYKSYGKTVDAVKAEDVTVSLFRETKPEGLFRYLAEHQYVVENPYPGIYYVKGMVWFPTQIVVTKELDRKTHFWLWVLSDQLRRQDIWELLEKIGQLQGKEDREWADSILEVSIEANRQIFKDLIGDDRMCQALMELMEPQLLQWEKKWKEEGKKEGKEEGKKEGKKEGKEEGKKEGKEEGKEEGLRMGIMGMVEVLRDLGHEDAKIKAIIIKKYGLSVEEAGEYLQNGC